MEYFIKAAHLCPANIEFRIYGDGMLRRDLERLSNGRVVFKGFLNKIIDEYYKDVDLLVVPTIVQEALPLVVVDAKSVGLPVIVTRPGGQAEIVDDDVDGILVPMKDEKSIAEAIQRISKDIDKYNAMSHASFDSSKKFSYERYKATIIKTFSDI